MQLLEEAGLVRFSQLDDEGLTVELLEPPDVD